jgi:hypothetical protein
MNARDAIAWFFVIWLGTGSFATLMWYYLTYLKGDPYAPREKHVERSRKSEYQKRKEGR